MDNLGALLTAAGLTFAHVVRTTVFLADMNDFAAVNEVYASYFTDPRPARVTVQAARLPRDARLEIDAIASYALSAVQMPRQVPTFVHGPSLVGTPALIGRRSTSTTPSTPRSDFITRSRCLTSLISTVTSIRARRSSSVWASMLRMLVLMSAILALTAASSPFRS